MDERGMAMAVNSTLLAGDDVQAGVQLARDINEDEEVRELGIVQSSSVAVPNAAAPSVTAKTILSGTVETEYDRKLDDTFDAQSVMS